jgi:hypothetical protein
MPQQAPFLAEKCVELLSAAAPRLAVIQHSDPWHGFHARGEVDAATTVKYVYLLPGSGARIALHLYPADTLSQARSLYADPIRVDALLALRDVGWTLRPNFHFGFMSKGLTWTRTSLRTDAYVSYWVEHIAGLGVYRREDWKREVARLRDEAILDAADVEQFERDFTNTERNHATPRPGLRLEQTWELARALQPGFPAELRATLRQAFSALGEASVLACLS